MTVITSETNIFINFSQGKVGITVVLKGVAFKKRSERLSQDTLIDIEEKITLVTVETYRVIIYTIRKVILNASLIVKDFNFKISEVVDGYNKLVGSVELTLTTLLYLLLRV